MNDFNTSHLVLPKKSYLEEEQFQYESCCFTIHLFLVDERYQYESSCFTINSYLEDERSQTATCSRTSRQRPSGRVPGRRNQSDGRMESLVTINEYVHDHGHNIINSWILLVVIT